MVFNRHTSQSDDKAVGWDIDFYNSLDDTACLVCLTNKEKYVLGQALRQARWSTRWDSLQGTALPDIDAIASELDLKMSLDGCIDFCAEVVECIETDLSTQNALTNLFEGSFLNGDSVYVNEAGEQNALGFVDTTGCNLDNLFGATTGITDLFNNIALDIIEIISANANASGRIGDIIEAIPVLGELPLDDLFQIVESFFDDMEQNYQSAYTVNLRDSIRCDLFCIAQEQNCLITIDDMYDYFVSKLDEAFIPNDLLDFVNLVLTLNTNGTLIVYAWHVALLGFLKFTAYVFGFNFTKVSKMMSALWNDPDSDWSTLCDCGWIYQNDFLANQDSWVWNSGVSPTGTWSSGTGWEHVDWESGLAQYRRLTSIERIITPSEISQVRMTYDLTKGSVDNDQSNGLSIVCIKNDDSQVRFDVIFADLVSGNGQVATFNLDEPDIKTIRLSLTCSKMTTIGGLTGTLNITDVEVRGTGTNPF